MQRFNFRGLAAGDSTYYRDEVVRVRVLFTQHVTVDTSGGEPYLDLTIGSTTRRANFGSSRQNYLDFRYRVQADDFDGDGVSVPANGVKLNGARITAKDDTSANANVAHDSAAGGPSRKVDGSKHRPPEVRSVTFSNSPASGDTYGYGEKIEATVAFSHRVLATTTGGTPSLALTIGAHTRQATLTRAGRRTRLTFSYTVQAGDLAPAGASIAANAVRLNGGTITHDADTATHAALAHGAVAADSTRKVNGRQGPPAEGRRSRVCRSCTEGQRVLAGRYDRGACGVRRLRRGEHDGRQPASGADDRHGDPTGDVLGEQRQDAGVRVRGAVGRPGRGRREHRGQRAGAERCDDKGKPGPRPHATPT